MYINISFTFYELKELRVQCRCNTNCIEEPLAVLGKKLDSLSCIFYHRESKTSHMRDNCYYIYIFSLIYINVFVYAT